MEQQMPVKRQRLEHTVKQAQAQAPALTAKQRSAVQVAQQLETDVAIDEQLHRLCAGKAQRGEVAWSPHNLIACASTSSWAHPAARAHVVLRYASARSPTPCHLYPPQNISHTSGLPTPPNGWYSSPAEPIGYEGPTSITFSPCGFYLCAYFPLRNRNTLPRTAKDSFQGLDSNESIPVDSIPVMGQPGSASGRNTASYNAERATGKLCIWSRAETGALNDWTLIHHLSVSENSGRKHANSHKADNVLKVDEHGHRVAKTDSSPETDKSPDQGGLLQGGVIHILWLNQRRRTVISPNTVSSRTFNRLAARGPTFLPSTSQAEPDSNLGLLVFGRQGQVVLIHSRQCDRTTKNKRSPVGSTCFGHIQSSIYVPDIQPAPATLDSQTGEDDIRAATAVSQAPTFESNEADISHLTAGMSTNSATILIASKRLPYTNATLDLIEISVNLTGEAVSITTRPFQTISLVAGSNERDTTTGADGTSVVDDEDTLHTFGSQHLSGLDWAEVEEDPAEDTKSAKLGCLRLLATFSRSEEASYAVTPEMEAQTRQLDSAIKVWDIHRAEKELSEAFSSLEGRRTGHAPKRRDWQARLSLTKRVANRAITSLIARVSSLPFRNIGLITVITSSPKSGVSSAEQVCFLDLEKMTIRPLSVDVASTLPYTLRRSSALVVSPNGGLAATLSFIPSKGFGRKMVVFKLPHIRQFDESATEAGQSADQERYSSLLALARLRDTDAVDIVRYFGQLSADKYAKVLNRAADLLQFTTSPEVGKIKSESDRVLPANLSRVSRVNLGHALQMLQLRILMGDSANLPKSSACLEPFLLELGLCLQVLRLARVKVDSPTSDVKTDDKDKVTSASSSPPASVGARVYYRLDGIWPILAQLQWLLMLLDRVARSAVLTTSTGPQTGSFEQEIARMLDNMQTPRRFTLDVLIRFCDFKEWLLSTTRKQNLPPARFSVSGMEEQAPDSGISQAWGHPNGLSSGSGAGVTAVSEQIDLARDALRHILVSSSVGLDEITRVLTDIDARAATSPRQQTTLSWWSELYSPPETAGSAHSTQENGKRVLESIIEPEKGALVDLLTLFVSPGDLLDERSVLYDGVPVSNHGSSAREHPRMERDVKGLASDIIRKVSLKSAVTQSAIQNMALANPAGLETGVVVMRKKSCVRCNAVSQDAVVVTTTPIAAPEQLTTAGTSATIASQYAVDIRLHKEASSGSTLSSFAERFKYACVCGGGWWVAH